MTRHWRLSRRRLIGSAAATACVGCGVRDGSGSAVTAVPSSSAATTTVSASTAPPASEVPAELDELAENPPPGFDQIGASSFGGVIDAGAVADAAEATATAPLFVPEARAYLVAVADAEREVVAAALDPALRGGVAAGFLALYQKCPHLGCRVPFCDTSAWFECGCHGSRYTALGEHREGPSPRGMDAFPCTVDADRLLIDTTRPFPGLPLGTVVVDQPPAGPHCTDAPDP